MIRDRLKRLAAEALRIAEEERDSSRVRVYTAPWILGAGDPIRDGAIALDHEGRVVAAGPGKDLLHSFEWAQRADLDGILLPGLINAHARLEIGEVDPLPEGLGLTRKLRAIREMLRADERLDPDSREAKVRAAVRQCVASGTAAVGDVTDSLRAVPSMGREGLYGVVFHEVGEFSKRRAAKALAAAAVEKARIVPWPEGVRYRIAPHSLYSTAESALKDLFSRAVDKGVITAIRLAETEEDWDLLEGDIGNARSLVEAAAALLDDLRPLETDPLSYVEQLGGLNEQVMLVHMNHATRDMVERVGAANAPLVLCPRAALHDTGQLPPLPAFLEEGCRIALGTDSSSADQSVLREAAELHAAFPEIPSLVLLNAATAGGADALSLDSMGSFQPGTTPGVLHADLAGQSTEDPSGWLLRAGNPDLAWLARPAPPHQAA
ncbi:MAG: amidohydrolase family protein [Myxococcota bacterium]|nr:amidohydrolase family protein [Myxococcota bacterium]